MTLSECMGLPVHTDPTFSSLKEVTSPKQSLETRMFNFNTSLPLVAAAMGLTLTLCAGPTAAQTFPDKPIRLVVPYPAGGPLDIAARAIAEASRAGLGSVIVDNRSGAGGNIGADSVAKAPADGYTLLLGAVATHSINPSLYPKMPYDAQKDFAPLTLIANVPNVLVLNNEFASKNKINTVTDLIAYLKQTRAKPSLLRVEMAARGTWRVNFSRCAPTPSHFIFPTEVLGLHNWPCSAVKCSSCSTTLPPPRRAFVREKSKRSR